ncbi:MAG: GNAT family N-acetyltransferase [Candidatus Izemoplasmatales bacterium]|nr:GNAT family N-acetyltransferase [Candidatus Izemoplasmatales bacterium]MDD4595325.1 GNAT family N-acetyltransferase [Candidatus Izemoplasmatales bacterium]
MMEYRSCLLCERSQAIELSKTIFKPNMGDQFLCLFSEKNIDRMLIAIDDNIIVSMVNYYPATVLLQQAKITTGSVGSVGTIPEYRGKKIASKLLKIAEDKMLSEAITLMIISGQGGLYSAIGADYAGNATEWFAEYEKTPKLPLISLKPYADSLFPQLKAIYEQEHVRYLRDNDEFRLLIKGQTFPDSYATYPFEMILHDGNIVAYVILQLENNPERLDLGIKEYGGDRAAIVAAFKLLLAKYNKKIMHFASDPHDEIEQYLSGCEKKQIHQFTSFKIIDFQGFMHQLKPYWEAIVPESKPSFKYSEASNNYFLFWGNERLQIEDITLLTRMIFGYDQDLNLDYSQCPLLEAFVKQVFPIPFAWTHNINYQ